MITSNALSLNKHSHFSVINSKMVPVFWSKLNNKCCEFSQQSRLFHATFIYFLAPIIYLLKYECGGIYLDK